MKIISLFALSALSLFGCIYFVGTGLFGADINKAFEAATGIVLGVATCFVVSYLFVIEFK